MILPRDAIVPTISPSEDPILTSNNNNSSTNLAASMRGSNSINSMNNGTNTNLNSLQFNSQSGMNEPSYPLAKIDENEAHLSFSYTKIVFVIALFLLSLVSFVIQTEVTSYLYSDLGFSEPILLLFLTHGSWWLLWPLQFIIIALYKAFRRWKLYKFDKSNQLDGYMSIHNSEVNLPSSGTPANRRTSMSSSSAARIPSVADENTNTGGTSTGTSFPFTVPHKKWKGWRKAFASSVKAQHRNIFHSAELTAGLNVKDYKIEYGKHQNFKSYSNFFKSTAITYIFKSTFYLSFILNIAGLTWYIAMSLSTGADVTAIYNCSAFTAYIFAIPILGDKFSWLKMSSVITAIGGVFIVAYTGKSSSGNTDPDQPDVDKYPNRLMGNVIILIGAILYGLYEVIYKKRCCPPSNEVSARRQATFSNFSMCFIGINTLIILGIPMLFVHITSIYKFNIPSDPKSWFYIIISIFANLTFSCSFLALMALTSPVLSSVSSLVTILIVGLTEWLLRGQIISSGQWIGYLLVLIGFSLLTYASWNEISEEDQDDVLLTSDVESIISTASNS
ncbi:unnamed protein product [[Candida] boidinii]|uniref:Unnamed protein product n=1 Tax=Candida boidinii TaxID=5477 RepID=A0A9W6SX11_CANBO|nr:hypothetical protein B5S30_g1031 [[Candida] boidinii]OWB82396.1 hypothetical protein B5S33_g1021 [[Candida] boidinii]GME67861.1 unnamed protein product [[Candida] boidinii]GME97338.1 unnamed protein product [[Candida] boidinii]GMF99700.1 unnamed protein product [[Candida] boidinii]